MALSAGNEGGGGTVINVNFRHNINPVPQAPQAPHTGDHGNGIFSHASTNRPTASLGNGAPGNSPAPVSGGNPPPNVNDHGIGQPRPIPGNQPGPVVAGNPPPNATRDGRSNGRPPLGNS